MDRHPVAVIGAGIGGLSAALALATRGVDVVVFERAATPGGKLREVEVGGARIDSGPTVFTMRGVFDEIFAEAGAVFDERVQADPLEVLARHAWDPDRQLDLFASRERCAEAIAAFAGPAEGRRYLAFCAQARRTFETLEKTFIRAQRPTPIGLTQRTAAAGIGGLLHIKPFNTLWGTLQSHFRDPRLQQLFGRYATYCGSSPFLAPATLMLVAHVEQEGVWVLRQGMARLAAALHQLAEAHGVEFRFGREADEIRLEHGRVAAVHCTDGETQPCSAAICNAEPAALAAGLFGAAVRGAVPARRVAERSLSALTFSLLASPGGIPLLHHNVFFSRDYRGEFDDIFRRRRLPRDPTVYLCAQDRAADGGPPSHRPERLFCLVNAPPVGDLHRFDTEEIAACATKTLQTLGRCGLQLSYDPAQAVATTPTDFERLFPASGGALYGQASHGWRASFTRPGSRTRIRGLYLAGGATHPGPGVPMAAVSGRLAAESLLEDRASTARSSRVVMPGGTSTH
jgi:1-hydroxycarotenoid 3,4-desaturase